MTPNRINGLALLGATLFGVSIGFRVNLELTTRLAFGIPLVMFGVLLLTTPALYITSAFSGVAPSARVMVHQMGATLRDGGVILLGVTPALLFMGSTTTDPVISWFLGMVALVVTATIVFSLLHRRLFEGARGKSVPLFIIWSLVTLGIGHHMLTRLMA